MIQVGLISIYENTFSKTFSDVPYEMVIDGIKEGRWKELINKLRTLDEKAYKAEKTKLPAVTWSGTFTERLDKCLSVYSNMLVLDIDNIGPDTITNLKMQFIQDPYIHCAFVSPSAKGLKILVKVNTTEVHHTAAFLHLQKVFQDKYLFKVDDSGKNLSRLCYVSFDPGIIWNPNSTVFEIDTRFGEVKTYQQTDKLKNYTVSKDTSHIFTVCRKWVDNTIEYASGQRNRHVHAMACALNRCGVSIGDAEALLKNEYNDLEEREIHGCVKSAYFHNGHQHGTVEVKNIGNSVEKFKAPPYIANYTDDVVINDIMQTTAMLYHHNISRDEIGRIISKMAKCYKLEGFIDIDRATLGDVMNKGLEILNNNVIEQTISNALPYAAAEDIGVDIIDTDINERVVPTVFFDEPLRGGIMPGNFYGLMGVGGTFKSVFAQFLSVAISASGKGVLYLNGEMSKMQWYERLAAICLRINLAEKMKSGEVNKGNIQLVINEIKKVTNQKLTLVSGSGFNYTNILSTIKNIEAKQGFKIELVVVDGITQMDNYGMQEVPAAIENTRICKEIAKHAHDGNGVAVIGLMHISGDQAEAKTRRDNGPYCRGGGKTIANMDGYFSTSLFEKQGAMREIGSREPEFIPGQFNIRLVDKRSGAGTMDAVIQVSQFLELVRIK